MACLANPLCNNAVYEALLMKNLYISKHDQSLMMKIPQAFQKLKLQIHVSG